MLGREILHTVYTFVAEPLVSLPEGDVPDDAPAQFAAGMLYGVNRKDKRDYILSCFTPSQALTSKLTKIVDLYSRGWWPLGEAEMRWEYDHLWADSMEKCDKTNEYFVDFFDTYDELMRKPLAGYYRIKNYLANEELIKRDFGYFTSEYDLGVYFNSGMFYGEAMKAVITGEGPAPGTQVENFIQ